jgi:hypothetical protein
MNREIWFGPRNEESDRNHALARALRIAECTLLEIAAGKTEDEEDIAMLTPGRRLSRRGMRQRAQEALDRIYRQ